MPEVAWCEPFLDNIINLVCVLVPLFLLGQYINRKTRLIDLLIAFLISRIPYFVLPLFNINSYMRGITEEITRSIGQEATGNPMSYDFHMGPMDTFLIMVFGVLSILAMIWSITLLYNGFKTATNAKTVGHKVLFALALILAEVLSKVVIFKMIVHS
jgi:hypothetical protein